MALYELDSYQIAICKNALESKLVDWYSLADLNIPETAERTYTEISKIEDALASFSLTEQNPATLRGKKMLTTEMIGLTLNILSLRKAWLEAQSGNREMLDAEIAMIDATKNALQQLHSTDSQDTINKLSTLVEKLLALTHLPDHLWETYHYKLRDQIENYYEELTAKQQSASIAE